MTADLEAMFCARSDRLGFDDVGMWGILALAADDGMQPDGP